MRASENQSERMGKQSKCCWKGCCDQGGYPAPKSRENTKDRYNFCLDHIKRYNKAWDFFKGMGQDEIEAFHIDSITGHRKTSKRDTNHRNFTEEDLREELFREFGFGEGAKRKKETAPDSDMKYLRVLGLIYPITLKDIKLKYKELAKKYHPDVKDGADEEKFKEVSEAYQYLKNCGIK
jgi:hypothetical protein